MAEHSVYWMHETSGVLRPAIEAYLTAGPMTEDQIAAMRAYLRAWISSPFWGGAFDLRRRIETLTTRGAIKAWLDDAVDIGIDPL